MSHTDEQAEQADALEVARETAGAKQPGEEQSGPEEEQDPTRWNLDEGEEIVPGRFALKRLGGGYDYEAYLAWDDHLYSLVVAKCLRPHLLDNGKARSAMEREAGHLLSLNHPVVVRGFTAVLDGPRPHLVMEHLEGPNLASLLKRYGPLQLEQLLPLTLQICAAVHYLGAEELVHLDIKPRNIIMGAPPRLIDLSVARTFKRAARITGHIGTDAYMAPEQCAPSRATIGHAADIWGLGATLHHALAGRVPFPRPGYDKDRDSQDAAVRWPQLHRAPEPLPREVPSPLQDIVGRCLEPEPADRPTVPEIVEAIEPMIVALPTRPVLRRARPGRRH